MGSQVTLCFGHRMTLSINFKVRVDSFATVSLEFPKSYGNMNMNKVNLFKTE